MTTSPTQPVTTPARTPTRALDAARSVASRIRLSRALTCGAIGFGAGSAAAGLAMIITTRLPAWHAPAPWIAGGVAVLSAIAGLAIGWRRAVAPSVGAGRADDVLGLHDRLTSAVELAAENPTEADPARARPFVNILFGEAESAATGVHANRLVPLTLHRGWWIGIACLALGSVGWTFLPMPEPDRSRSVALATPESIADADEALRETIAALEPDEDGPVDAGGVNPDRDRVTDELTAIRDRLERGEVAPDDALAEAASELERAASVNEEETEDTASQAIADAARSARETAAEDVSPESARLAEALSSGDLARARDAARELMRNAEGMPPEARERIARDLERLSDALDEAARREAARDERSDADSAMTDALRDRVGDLTDESRVAEALEREGVDPASAEELAKRIARDERANERRDRATDDIERLRDAVDAASDDLRDNTGNESEQPADEQTSVPTAPPTDPSSETPENPPTNRDGTERDQPPEPREGETGDKTDDTTGETPGDSTGENPRNQQDSETQPQSQPGTPPGSEQPGTSREQSEQGRETTPSEQGESGERREAAEPGQQQPGDRSESPDAQRREDQESGGQDPDGQTPEGQQPSEQPTEQPGDQPGNQPGEQPGGQESGQDGEQTAQPGDDPAERSPGAQDGTPGDQPTGQPDGQPGGQPGEQASGQPDEQPDGQPDGQPGRQPGSGKPGLDQLTDELERLAESQRDRREQREVSDDMRKRAQELLDQASPEQRERLEDLAERFAQRDAQRAGGPRPYDATGETVDARDENSTTPGEREQTLREWFNPEGEPVDGVDRSERTPAALREAAESADRAVEQQRVPPRYRKLVREVFKNIRERAAESGADGAPAELGKDATPEPSKTDPPKKDGG